MEITDSKKIILDSDFNVGNLSLFGLKLGDSVDKIKSDTENRFQFGSLWVGSDSDASYRADKETKSQIVEFLLRGEFLVDLKLTSPKRISKSFGKPKAIEKRNGTHYYFYPERKIVVAWWAEYDKLFGVYIGENIIEQTYLTSKDFLNKYFEFKGMVPDVDDWNLKKLKYNEPRYYRLKELNSLMKAFELGGDLLNDLKNKEFLKNREESVFEPIYQDIEKYASDSKIEKDRFGEEEKQRMRKQGISMIFQEFMRFIEEIRKTLGFNSCWLESGSISSRYIINKTSRLLKTVDQTELKKIEELICKVIDPYDKRISLSELIDKFGYPDVDLQAIDMDNY